MNILDKMTVRDYIFLCKIPEDNITDDESKLIKLYNKELIDKYPFLKPYNVMTGKDLDNYNYEYTWLDDMPDGWRIAFGMDMIEEIRNELLKFPYDPKDNYSEPSVCENDTWLNHYKITQIKEKFGELRWYDAGIPGGHSRTFIDIGNVGTVALGEDNEEECQVWNIINKYSKISEMTCFKCGEPAKYISTGWICPWCEKCANDYVNKENSYLESSGKEFRHSLKDEFMPIE